jgi:hypothetical protein
MIMLDKCLNPACSAKFHTLRDGRVFVKEVDVGFDEGGKEHSHKPAYFWLSGACCRTMTVVAGEREGSYAYSASGRCPCNFTEAPQLSPVWISESVLRRFALAR